MRRTPASPSVERFDSDIVDIYYPMMGRPSEPEEEEK